MNIISKSIYLCVLDYYIFFYNLLQELRFNVLFFLRINPLIISNVYIIHKKTLQVKDVTKEYYKDENLETLDTITEYNVYYQNKNYILVNKPPCKELFIKTKYKLGDSRIYIMDIELKNEKESKMVTHEYLPYLGPNRDFFKEIPLENEMKAIFRKYNEYDKLILYYNNDKCTEFTFS